MATSPVDWIDNLWTFLIIPLGWIYGIGAAIHTVLFEWQYAVEHGPMAWFLFGWLVGAFKGAVWPIWYII